MSTFTSEFTDVNDKALAAATADYNAAQPEGTLPLTPHQYAEKNLKAWLKSYQDQYIRIPSSEFLLRFPAGKIDAIKALSASNPTLAQYVEDIRVAPYVYTGSTLVRGGIAMLVGAGLLTQAQADVILT